MRGIFLALKTLKRQASLGMSAIGTKRTFALVAIKSAFDPKRTWLVRRIGVPQFIQLAQEGAKDGAAVIDFETRAVTGIGRE